MSINFTIVARQVINWQARLTGQTIASVAANQAQHVNQKTNSRQQQQRSSNNSLMRRLIIIIRDLCLVSAIARPTTNIVQTIWWLFLHADATGVALSTHSGIVAFRLQLGYFFISLEEHLPGLGQFFG